MLLSESSIALLIVLAGKAIATLMDRAGRGDRALN